MKNRKTKNQRYNPFSIQEGKFKFGRLDGFSYRLGWTEDSFVDGDGRSETVGKSFDIFKLKIIGLVFFLLIFTLLVRVAWLQIARGDYYYSLAEGNRIRIERIEAKRGIIYDRNRRPLVRNTANWLVYFIPADLPEDENEKSEIIKRLSRILGDMTEGEINDILDKAELGYLESFQPLFIVDNISHEKAMQVYLEAGSLPGVALANKTRREYDLYSLSLSHNLGYTGKINNEELEKFGEEYLPIDYIGKTGVEYFWENELKGKNGAKHIEVDALGKEKKIINQALAEDGHNLVLSLDMESQKKLEEIISDNLKKLKLTKAAAVVMNPNNGEVLALVSLPGYDNNAFARGISREEYSQLINQPDKPLFNRAVSGEYPSGSTIKPVLAAAALEEGIISQRTTFNSVGGISIGQWFFPDWKAGGHGLTDVRKALSQSVNTFFYYIGGGYQDFTGLGVDRMVNYFGEFGLGGQTGIDLIGEASGFLPTKEWKEKVKGERWYIGDTYHLAIGQGDILVTPLQVANFTAVFANGGSLYRPHLVKEILTGDDKHFADIETAPVKSGFIDSYNIQVVREGMRQTVTTGSAQSLQAVSVAVAGKTGTAQWSTKLPAHAWFTGFAPYENPEIVITVLIEQGGEGSATAAPIARDFLNWYFSRQGG